MFFAHFAYMEIVFVFLLGTKVATGTNHAQF